MRTIIALARESLAVQNACNLTGVVRSYARAISDLMEISPSLGTYEINHHPIAILWADKVAHLTGLQDLGNARVSRAYDAVNAIIAGGADAE